jgi:hypothetical protein
MASRAGFAKKLLAELRRVAPTITWTYVPDGYRIEGTGDHVLNLENVFADYARAGFFSRGEVLRRIARGALVAELPKTFQAARDALLPKVRERSWYGIAGLWADSRSPRRSPRCMRQSSGFARCRPRGEARPRDRCAPRVEVTGPGYFVRVRQNPPVLLSADARHHSRSLARP